MARSAGLQFDHLLSALRGRSTQPGLLNRRKPEPRLEDGGAVGRPQDSYVVRIRRVRLGQFLRWMGIGPECSMVRGSASDCGPLDWRATQSRRSRLGGPDCDTTFDRRFQSQRHDRSFNALVVPFCPGCHLMDGVPSPVTSSSEYISRYVRVGRSTIIGARCAFR